MINSQTGDNHRPASIQLTRTGAFMSGKLLITGLLSTKTMAVSAVAVLLLMPSLLLATPVWLHTQTPGLYSVSITELAASSGKRENWLREKALDGLIILRNARNPENSKDAQTAKYPVAWHFDASTDSILFVGDSYETFHSDENAYWFRWSNRINKNTLPMEVVTGETTLPAAVESAFAETLKFEQEPDFLYSTWTVASEQDADYWFWDYLYGGHQDQITVALNIPNPANTGTAQLRVTLRGWTDLYDGDEHQVVAELNGTAVGAAVHWDGFEEAQLVADFEQSLLEVDGNNQLVLRTIYAEGTHPGQWLDQIEIDYSRLPVAADDMLWMHQPAAGAQRVRGFTSGAILVVENPRGIAVIRDDVLIEDDGSGSWSVSFEATAGVDYLLAERGASLAAVLSPDDKSRLRKTSNRADYLIIAPRLFKATAEALEQHQLERFSDVKIVWLEDIYDEFSGGRKDPHAIAVFMKRVISRWSTAPSYVALIGKGSLDHKKRMGYSGGFLPVLMTSTPWALAASDGRLLGVDGGDAPFAIGRLPITSDEEGLAYVDKLIAYAAATPEVVPSEAVVVVDNVDDAGDFHANADALADLLSSLGFSGISKLYHPVDPVQATLVQSATWNTRYLSYDGHGSSTQVGDGHENFITATDAAALSNSAYPVFTALTCAAGDDSLPGMTSLASALVLNPAGGAIASLAPTGLSLDADAQLLGTAFVESLYGGGSSIGDALREAKIQTSSSISTFMPRIYSVIGDPALHAR